MQVSGEAESKRTLQMIHGDRVSSIVCKTLQNSENLHNNLNYLINSEMVLKVMLDYLTSRGVFLPTFVTQSPLYRHLGMADIVSK